jgi:hypothetical protein
VIKLLYEVVKGSGTQLAKKNPYIRVALNSLGLMKQNKRWIFILLVTAILLLIPLVAMQFTDEVRWTLSDFIVAGVLIFATGLLFDLVIRKIKIMKYRIAVLFVLLLIFLLIWIELAVGIF